MAVVDEQQVIRTELGEDRQIAILQPMANDPIAEITAPLRDAAGGPRRDSSDVARPPKDAFRSWTTTSIRTVTVNLLEFLGHHFEVVSDGSADTGRRVLDPGATIEAAITLTGRAPAATG